MSQAIQKPEAPTVRSILEKGIKHERDRAATRDAPDGERSMRKTVQMFNILYGLDLSEEQGWAFMVLLKQARGSQGQFNVDDYEDMAAYAALQGEAGYKERVCSLQVDPEPYPSMGSYPTERTPL